jgi:hypothetical protein
MMANIQRHNICTIITFVYRENELELFLAILRDVRKGCLVGSERGTYLGSKCKLAATQ